MNLGLLTARFLGMVVFTNGDSVESRVILLSNIKQVMYIYNKQGR